MEKIEIYVPEKELDNCAEEMKRKAEEVEDLELYVKEHVKKLKVISDNGPEQRTEEWFSMRKHRITASDIASCLKKNFIICDEYIELFHLKGSFKKDDRLYCNPYSTEKDFILKKNGYGEFIDNPATRWGNKFELPAQRFYEHLKGEEVWDFGLMLHPSVSWLAASPDGITPSGTMLEIKCPFQRKITGVVPLYYYFQTQIQLEVCGLEKCDYIECTIEIIDEETFKNKKDVTTKVYQTANGTVKEEIEMRCKGLLVSFQKNETYAYSPRKCKTYKEMLEWAKRKCKKYKKLSPRIEYYYFASFALVPIKRSEKWFNIVKPMLEKTWEKCKTFKYEDYKDHWESKKENKKEEKSVVLDYRYKLDECILD
jgi:putative phage-type endonuclease